MTGPVLRGSRPHGFLSDDDEREHSQRQLSRLVIGHRSDCPGAPRVPNGERIYQERKSTNAEREDRPGPD